MSTQKTGDEILRTYLSRYDSLTKQIEKLETFKKEREKLEIAIELLQEKLQFSSDQQIEVSPITKRIKIQPCMADVSYDFLENQQKPCFLNDIAKHILSTGYISRAQNFNKSVATALYESDKFKRVGNSLWSLTEW